MAGKQTAKTVTSGKVTKVIILKCNCEHDFQDEKYGKGNRVHNCCSMKNAGQARCTVCSNKRFFH